MADIPLITSLDLEVAPPSLSNLTSDWERLHSALSLAINDRPVEISLMALQELGAALRLGDCQVRLMLAEIGQTSRVRTSEHLLILPQRG